MANKPSRALVLYGDGLAHHINTTHRHLHSLASRACCGFLSLPHPPPSELDDERVLRELAELFDSREVYVKGKTTKPAIKADEQKSELIQKRFMGLKAAILTEELCLNSFARSIGCDILENMMEYPNNLVLSELLKLLGFHEGKILEENRYDLLLLHVGAGHPHGIEFINALTGKIMEIAQHGSAVGSRLHLSVIISYGCVSESGHSFSVLTDGAQDCENPFPRPRQSYTMKGGTLRTDVRNHFPMLIAQWQDGVTRRDRTSTYSFNDFKERGGILAIPADRFLHEIAFKLWKSPKYGA